MKRKIIPIIIAFLALLISACATLTGSTGDEIVDDSAITSSVKAKIADEDDLKNLKIAVSTSKGEVTLTGTVPSREIEVRLIKISLGVKGVKSVKDNLTVRRK